MAISYPLAMPTVGGIQSIDIRTTNAVVLSESPFTYDGQIQKFPGQRWLADVTLKPMKRKDAEQWAAWLIALNGKYGTFLLGDPNGTAPRGSATSATISGSAGSSSVTVTMTGTLKAGDWIQISSAADVTLHKVLVDKTNSGTLEIYPALRKDRFSQPAVLTNAKGVFRLASNENGYSISNLEIYGFSFGAIESVG